MAHSGVLFTMVPLGVVFVLLGWRLLSLGKVAAVAGLALLLYAPWFHYVNSYFPPGDRLAKWWLAGKPEPDSRPFTQVLQQAYNHLSISDVISNKLQNLKILAVPFHYVGPVTTTQTVGLVFSLQGSYFVESLALALLGLPLMLQSLFQTNLRHIWRAKTMTLEVLAIIVGLLSILFWVILSFGPPNAPTIAYADSYATFLCVLFGLVCFLARSRRLLCAAGAVSTAGFIVFLTISYRVAAHYINFEYLIVALAMACAVWFILRQLSRLIAMPDSAFTSASKGVNPAAKRPSIKLNLKKKP